MENVAKKNYIQLNDLEVYQLSRQLSLKAWAIYEKLDWQDKKTMGDQFIRSADSVGANVAEGYGRFHYLDKIRFYYNSRGSLFEAGSHWLELLLERNKISKEEFDQLKGIIEKLQQKLNNLISATYRSKEAQDKLILNEIPYET